MTVADDAHLPNPENPRVEVQIAPGMYFASIDAISDWSATP